MNSIQNPVWVWTGGFPAAWSIGNWETLRNDRTVEKYSASNLFLLLFLSYGDAWAEHQNYERRSLNPIRGRRWSKENHLHWITMYKNQARFVTPRYLVLGNNDIRSRSTQRTRSSLSPDPSLSLLNLTSVQGYPSTDNTPGLLHKYPSLLYMFGPSLSSTFVPVYRILIPRPFFYLAPPNTYYSINSL